MSGLDGSVEKSGCGRDAAAYVLGALEPDEARAFVSHTESCAACRDELAALAPVLDTLPGPAARPVPRALRRRVLRAVHAEPKARAMPRLRRFTPSSRAGWLTLGLAVSAAVIVQLGSAGSRVRVVPADIGQAHVRITGDHGELVVERLSPLRADRTYELWLLSEHGGAVPSTLFGVTSRGSADLGVPGDLHGVIGLVVTVEPRGGSPAPTTRAVIQLPLTHVQRS